MASAMQSAIIDLTGDDQNEESIANAQAACQKAFKAASILTKHFESRKTSKPKAYRSPYLNGDTPGKASPSSNASKPPMPSRLKTLPKAAGSDTPRLEKVMKNNSMPQQSSSVPRPSVSTNSSTLRTAGPRPALSTSVLERRDGNRQQRRESKSVTPNTNAPTIRTPRSAAISAKQNITETYSELEEWVNMDPNIIPQQACANTPKRLGRPNDDLDEWSPNSDTQNMEDKRKELGMKATGSPTPTAGRHEDSTTNEDNSLSRTLGVSTSLGSKKRKFSASSQSRNSPAKEARLTEKPSAYHKPTSADSAEPANRHYVRDGAVLGERSQRAITSPYLESDLKATRLERSSSGKTAVNTYDNLPPKTSNTDHSDKRAATQPLMLHPQVKGDSRHHSAFHEPFEHTTSEPEVYIASTVPNKYTALFEKIVYPAIRDAKKRSKDSLPPENLDSIGRLVISEVLGKLPSHSEGSFQADEEAKKKIKHFTKKLFRQKVRRTNAQSSQDSAPLTNDSMPQIATMQLGSSDAGGTSGGNAVSAGGHQSPANDSRPHIATVQLDSSDVGGTSGGNAVLTGGHRPPTADLANPGNISPSRATAVNEEAEGQTSRKQYLKPLSLQDSLQGSAQDPADERQTSPFGPNFDRGRYPALRRRRGNKYYTPTKPVKPKPKSKKHQTTTSDYLDARPSTGVLFNRPLTAPITGLLSNNSEITSYEAKSFADVLKAPREIGPYRHRTMADDGVTTSSSLSPISSQSQKSIATDQAAQLPRKRLLKEPRSPKTLRPIFRHKPATALDPSFEHVVAVLITDTLSSRPSQDAQRYSITSENRIQLVADQSIVKHVDVKSKVGPPKFIRIETKVVDPVRQPGRCISSLLRNRELGLSSRGRYVGTIHELHRLRSEMVEPWKKWKGASGDVVAVAWSPDSNIYAFGAAAHANIEDIQYNRPCNLLLGNLDSNQIRELPDHRIDRPRPETIPNGPNATQAVYNACDPKVYETVTSIAFSPEGDRMFTASHDCTVKIWNVSTGQHQCLNTLRHEAWVTSVEVSEHRPGVFATASKTVKDAIRIYYNSADTLCHVNFSASRAQMRPDWKIYPECLRWGPNHHTSHLLLAGFQQWEQQRDLLSGGGQLCLWDANALEAIKVTPSSQSVYAAAWHPTQPFFATGGSPGNNVVDKVNTKTVVRIWDVRTPKRCHVEYECPAMDMQDVTFSPLDPNIVTAGCTDGISYVWDWRWPDQVLHRLEHGAPLAELDHTRERQETDTGVMLSLWGPSGSLFYTGSSDGVIKAWDVRRHPNDVLISNIANFDVSIQSGAFSPDGSHLLVGDAEGGIQVLSSAPCGPRSNVQSTDAYINLVRAPNGSGLDLDPNDDNPGTEGIEAARILVESGQLEYHSKFGVGQGPKYQGPYAKYARKEMLESGVGRLRRRFEKKQPISKKGEQRENIAIPMTTLLAERKDALDREKCGDKTKFDGLDETRPFFSRRQGVIPIHLPSGNEGPSATVACGTSGGAQVEDKTILESEMIEENFWWPRLGEEEIERAKTGRGTHKRSVDALNYG